MAYILDDDPPRAATMNDRERGRLLGILHEIGLDRASSDLREFAMTQAALALRATWEQVADASRVSQQEARERYEVLRERFAPPAFPLNLPPGGMLGAALNAGEPGSAPAIFVPTCDVPGVSPSRLADLQHVLNAATIPFDGLVDGRFVPLPPGAKVLPAHPGRGWIKTPDEMTDPRYNRIIRATEEWAEAIPGLQCRLSSPGEQIIYFRLTPAGNDPGPIEMGR